MTMRDLALLYAAAGFHVLPLYTIVDGHCSCPKHEITHAKGKNSPGKHPFAEYAPHGGSGATTDPAVIMGWPEDGWNLGLAPTGGMFVIDVDDTEIVNRLLDPELALSDELIADLSGKGMHFYCICSSPTAKGGLLKVVDEQHPDGRTIGEIRSKPQYVVIPPSKHINGKLYRWLGTDLLKAKAESYIPTSTDPYDYATKILGYIGLQVKPAIPDITTLVPDGAVLAAQLPFAIPPEESTLLQLLTGTMPTNDRSATLFQLACECYRTARRLGETIDVPTVAGVVKTVDAISYHKYSGRSTDKDVLTLAARAQTEVAQELARKAVTTVPLIDQAEASIFLPTDTPLSQEPQAKADPLPLYKFDPVLGFLFAGGKQAERIANFEPKIKEVLEVWDGEQEARVDWLLQMGRSDLRLQPEHYATSHDFEKYVQATLGPDHIVEPGQWTRLLAGIKHYSLGSWQRRRSYSATGWLPDRDAFLLPSVPGAITANGIDSSIVWENDGALSHFLQYGVGVTPSASEADLAEALDALYNVAEPAIMVPMLIQAWGSALASLGAAKSIVHLFARTGSLKTTLTRLAMAIYGQFVDEEMDVIESWTGTSYSIQETMSRVRDMPLLVDDYKRAHGRADIVQLIQNYADGTARSRLSRDQKQQRRLVPHCLVISTGEDVWDAQESVMARTILIDVSIDDLDDRKTRASRAQILAVEGRLGQLGYAWIQWLCKKGQKYLRAKLKEDRVRLRDQARQTALGKQHARTASTVASLLAVDRIFRDFLADVVPTFAPQYEEIRARGWSELNTTITEQAEAAKGLSPYGQLTTELKEAFGQDMIRYSKRKKEGEDEGSMMAQASVGWVDDVYVLLTEPLAFGWYERQMRSRGKPITFTWSAFVQEAVRDHGAHKTTSGFYVYGVSGLVRGVQIPRGELLPDFSPASEEETIYTKIEIPPLS